MFDIEKLIEDYTPEPGPFPVVLPKGEVLTFRPFERVADWETMKQAAAGWYASLPTPGEDVGHPFEGLTPRSAEEAIMAFVIADRSVEPKIGQRDALRLLKAPMMASYLYDAIMERSKEFSSLALSARIERAKKNSANPPFTESDSPSPETSTDATPTS